MNFLFFLVLCSFCFHHALSENKNRFETTAERNEYLYNHSYGCTNLKELRPGESRDYRGHIPKCGCGYYGVRMSDSDPRQNLYNVTVTTSRGRLQRYECKRCDLCIGLKVSNICKPKANTMCSDICEDPCEKYIDILKKCGPDKDKCPERPTTTVKVDTPDVADSPKPPTREPRTHHRSPDQIKGFDTPRNVEEDDYYRTWLIVAVVVITASIIAVIFIIIAVLRNQNIMHQNSYENHPSRNSLLPQSQQPGTGNLGEAV